MAQPYQKKSRKSSLSKVRFWTITGILFLLILFASYFLSNNSIEIYSFQVTNVTPTSATVIWRTDRSTLGGVLLDDSPQAKASIFIKYLRLVTGHGYYTDSRDLKSDEWGEYVRGPAHTYQTHHIKLTDLTPDTTYTFGISNNYILSKDSELHTFKTPDEFTSLREPVPVYGRIESSTDVDLDEALVILQAVEANSFDDAGLQSQYLSTDLYNGTYVFDVGNLYDDGLQDEFAFVSGGEVGYSLRVNVLTPEGYFTYEIEDSNYQPIDTIVLDSSEIEVSFWQRLVSPVHAACNSRCVGDCQGCNIDTPENPLCVTYGCGYMSWCCGHGDDSCENHCINGKKDCNETGVDCGGGGCKTCENGNPESGGECEGSCTKYGGGGCIEPNPATGKCGCAIDGRITTEAGETGRNCGGPYCPPCTNAGSHCFDRVKNQDEEGVDCGGSCAASCPTEGVADDIGNGCDNEGEVFTCADRPDWNCWCYNGRVTPYHSKSSNLYADKVSSKVGQEWLRRYYNSNSKLGINTAMVNGLNLGTIPNLDQSGYYLKILASDDDKAIQELVDEWNRLPPGVVPVLRYCVGSDCAFSDPKHAADVAKRINSQLGRPVAVIGGPNEPLLEPWTVSDKSVCGGDCTGNVDAVAKSTAAWMNEFLAETEGNEGLIRLSPAFNSTHPQFNNLVSSMKGYGANFNEVDGYAANAYNVAGRSITDYVGDMKSQGFSNIFLTEVGMFNNPENPAGGGASSRDAAYQQLSSELDALSEDPDVAAYMLFNGLSGMNPDPNFDYNELTPEEWSALSQEHAGSGSFGAEIAEAPAEVLTAQNAGANNVPATTSGGTTCRKGWCINVCTEMKNGQPSSYVEFRDSPDCPELAPHVFVTWPDKGQPDVVNMTPGEYFTRQVDDVCIHIHDDEWARPVPGTNELAPEHETMCAKGGNGANVGVTGGGQGVAPFQLIPPVLAESSSIEPGVYDVSGVNVDVTTQTIDVVNEGTIRFFYDDNENGVLDEGERYLTDEEAEPIEVNLQKQLDVIQYQISPGWNTFSFPMYMQGDGSSNIVVASELVAYLRASGIDVTHVAAYRAHEFLFYSVRLDNEGELKAFGVDFGIMPGEGYFVKANNTGTAAVAGSPAEGAIKVPVGVGWNLLGFYKQGEDYFMTYDLIEQMRGQGIPADTVTRWESGRYVSVIQDEGQFYGRDFEVYPTRSYWVRVENDDTFTGGTFTPE